MPMAGIGKRLVDGGYEEPKPLIKVLGKPIVKWAIESVGIEGNYIFCCQRDHIKQYSLDKMLKSVKPDCDIISINHQTDGPVETILEATRYIDNDDELIISDSDHCLVWDYDLFNNKIRKLSIDACVMVFPEEQDSDALSYVKLNGEGYVTEAAEKSPISKIASVGLHYFRKGSDFVRYANIMIKKNFRIKNEFYVTPVYNEFVTDKKKVITFPVTRMWPLGTSKDLQNFFQKSSFS